MPFYAHSSDNSIHYSADFESAMQLELQMNQGSNQSPMVKEVSWFMNLTPHSVTIFSGNSKFEFPKMGLARVATIPVDACEMNGVPFFITSYGETQGLPQPETGVTYIVSMVVAQANPFRTDLVFPASDPANAVRDGEGNLIGFKALTRY